MKVLVDTNILISAVFVHDGMVSNLITNSSYECTFIVCKYVFDECVEVIQRKRPNLVPIAIKMITSDPFCIMNPDISDIELSVHVRDPDDVPVIKSAIALDCDIILSGDKDITSIQMDQPMILKPNEFASMCISDGSKA